MYGIPHEAITIAGLAVIGFVGERTLKEAGQANLAQFLAIICTAVGTAVVVKVFWRSVEEALAFVGVHL